MNFKVKIKLKDNPEFLWCGKATGKKAKNITEGFEFHENILEAQTFHRESRISDYDFSKIWMSLVEIVEEYFFDDLDIVDVYRLERNPYKLKLGVDDFFITKKYTTTREELGIGIS